MNETQLQRWNELKALSKEKKYFSLTKEEKAEYQFLKSLQGGKPEGSTQESDPTLPKDPMPPESSNLTSTHELPEANDIVVKIENTEPPKFVPPSGSVTAEEVKQVQERSNSDKLRDAFASTPDADSKAAIGRILANPQVDYMTTEEIRAITFNQVCDGDGRAAVYKFFPETILE